MTRVKADSAVRRGTRGERSKGGGEGGREGESGRGGRCSPAQDVQYSAGDSERIGQYLPIFSRFGGFDPEVSRIKHLEAWAGIKLNIEYFQKFALTAWDLFLEGRFGHMLSISLSG